MEKLMGVAEIEIDYTIKIENPIQIRFPEDAMECLKHFYNLKTIKLQEQFVIIYVNTASIVIGVYRHSIGGIAGTLVDIRLLLAVALKIGASGIFLSHNHPSGNLVPSPQDIDMTNKIKKAARLHDIKLHDHFIVDGDFNYFQI